MSMEQMPWNWGPETRVRPAATKTGLGRQIVVRGNPLSWAMDCIGNCWPFTTLRGQQDAATQRVRTGVAPALLPSTGNALGVQPGIASRGVYSVPEPFEEGVAPLPNEPPTSSGTTGGSASILPVTQTPVSSDCPEGRIRVDLGGGRYTCKVPWGR